MWLEFVSDKFESICYKRNFANRAASALKQIKQVTVTYLGKVEEYVYQLSSFIDRVDEVHAKKEVAIQFDLRLYAANVYTDVIMLFGN